MKTKGDKSTPKSSKVDELLTLSEVALYLKVAEKTVLRMIRRNEIPCVRIGGQWRFPQSIIEQWVYSRVKGEQATGLLELIESDRIFVPLSRLTRERFVQLHIVPGTKKEVLTQLINPLSVHNIIPEPRLFLEKLLQREEMASTAIGAGVAFPHIRHPGENNVAEPVIIFGVCPQGTQFQALDGQKTHLFCVLCIRGMVAHLRLLSKLMQLCRITDAVHMLCASKTRNDFMGNLMKLEQKCPRHDSNV